MQKDWLFSTDEYICELRTVAVLVKENKILVQKDRNGNEYALPSGHVKIGETLENGLIRENNGRNWCKNQMQSSFMERRMFLGVE